MAASNGRPRVTSATNQSVTNTSRRSSVASTFMEYGPHENDSGRELFEACRTGDVTRVRYLIQNGCGC